MEILILKEVQCSSRIREYLRRIEGDIKTSGWPPVTTLAAEAPF